MKVILLGTLYKRVISIFKDASLLQLDDDDDDSDGVVPQRRNQVSQEQEDLVAKGEAFFNVDIFSSTSPMFNH